MATLGPKNGRTFSLCTNLSNVQNEVASIKFTILDLDSQSELAIIKRSMSGQSTLFTLDGREYRWRCKSFWRDVWTWLNNEDTPLLHLMRGSRVQLEPAAQDLPDLALLATVGWYLHKQQEEEATVAAIVPIIG